MADQDESRTTLAHRAIGLPALTFQGITNMGPAVAVTSAIPFAFIFAGGSAPLAVLFAFVACLLVASCMRQLSKHISSAGGLFTYAAQGLHPSLGFLVAWAYGLALALISPLLYLILGITVANQLNFELGWSSSLWWVWVFVIGAIVYCLGYFRVKFPTRVGIILGTFELVVFTILCVWLIVKAGHANTFAVFSTKYATLKGFHGFSGIVAAGVFTVLAYIGFEEVIPLGEEGKDPQRNVGRGLMVALVGVGALFLLAAYAASVYFGPAKGLSFADFNSGNPWVQLARNVWGLGWVIVFLVIIDSYVANCNAASIALTRTWYSMGRIRILPSAFARVHPRSQSPHIALGAQVTFSVAVSLILGAAYGALVGDEIVGTFITLVFVPIYMITCAACASYYWRNRRAEFNWVVHGLIPLIGVLILVPVFLAGAGIPSFSFVSKLTAPLSYAGPALGVWMICGVGYMAYLYKRHPERVTDTGRIFLAKSELSEVEIGQEQ